MSPSSPQRVGYVLKMYPRFSETFIVNELLAHERAGTEIEIFSLRPPGDGRFHEIVGGVRAPVAYVPHAGLHADTLWSAITAAGRDLPGAWEALADAVGADSRDVFQALWLARAIQDRGVTHLHAHFANVAAVVARLAARLAGISYSVTAHAKDIFHEDVDAQVLGALLTDARAAVTVSDFNVEHLRGIAPDAPLHRVYNGLALDRLAWSDPSERPARILAVGRLVEKKGFDVLIEACALLRADGREVACDIVGTGNVRAQLAELVAEHGLEDRVRLVGARSQEEVHAAMREAAVLAVPCVVGADGNRDGLPTVLLEAMALGTPCVATPVTGIPEAVEHDVTGLLVGERRPRELADALARLLDDGALRARLATAARTRLEAEFDVDRNAARLRDLAFVAESAAASTVAIPPVAAARRSA